MKIKVKSLLIAACIIIGSSSSGFAQTYTFTNCAVVGAYGPTQADINTAYAATNLNGLVTVNMQQGIQKWVVPATGTYLIQAIGATGGNELELGREVGHPANMTGEFMLTAGDTIKILVGHHGFVGSLRPGWGGGGGSFVALNDNTPLLVAGGCGAVHTDLGANVASTNQNYSSLTTTGNNAQNGTGTWPDGNGATGGDGGDGAGFFGDGTIGNGSINMLPPGLTVHTIPQSFVNGGDGDEIGGGFGGGGGVTNTYGGGGGGYSGGQGGISNPWEGGGGASFNSGANQVNILDVNNLFVEAHGVVVITSACAPTTLTPDLATLADVNEECSSTPTAPTATNDCAGIAIGVPDVTLPITTPGTTLVTWTYNDGTTIITQTQNVILTDVTTPVADSVSLPDLVDMCTVDSIPAPTATDNCIGQITGTTTTIFPITGSGTTVVTWIFDDGNGNISTQTQNVINPGVDNGIVLVGAQLNATGLIAGYQWLDCENNYAVIPGETDQFYTPQLTGNYAVEVTQGACTDTSVCVLVDYTSIDELNGSQIVFQPNPSLNGFFTVVYEGELLNIEIIDMLGRILELPIDLQSGLVDGSELSMGKYMVAIVSDKGRVIKPIVIMQ